MRPNHSLHARLNIWLVTQLSCEPENHLPFGSVGWALVCCAGSCGFRTHTQGFEYLSRGCCLCFKKISANLRCGSDDHVKGNPFSFGGCKHRGPQVSLLAEAVDCVSVVLGRLDALLFSTLFYYWRVYLKKLFYFFIFFYNWFKLKYCI